MPKDLDAKTVETIPEGRAWSMRERTRYVTCARREGQLVVEMGWVVPEAYDDDYECASYHPFKHLCPWVGRERICTTSQEAAETYNEWRNALLTDRATSIEGTVIGSVCRD